MAPSRHIIIFLLTYFLLTACLCTEPSRSVRRKRGIAKMMMHIMWDPVRLIRYWYAYDVSREIAKSWRKIIPTILFLPITQHMPQSHGLAKYVHPTVGIRDHNKSKLKVKYPAIPVASYQGSAGSLKPVAISPTAFHHVYPSKYTKIPQYAEHLYQTSSKESESAIHYKHRGVPHVVVGHVPYESDKGDSNQYSVAHYFVADGTSREEIPTSDKEMFPLAHEGSIDEDISSSPSHSVFSNSHKKRPLIFQSMSDENNPSHRFPHVEPNGATIRDENGQLASPILHPGQEFHIVLHPIPINDFNPNSLKPSSDGKPIKFVPVQGQSNESNDKNSGLSPILFKAVSLETAESDSSHEDRAVETPVADDSSSIRFQIQDNESSREEKTNITGEGTKTRVTWIQQKNANSSRRTDQKERDMPADGTVKKTVSIHWNAPRKNEYNGDRSHSFTLKRQNINMDRLREDLKHGTPVLIPFNRNIYSSEVPCDANHGYPFLIPHEHLNNDYRTEEQSSSNSEVLNVPMIRDSSVVTTSSENSEENNSSKRLVLFLKKRKHS